ncbi:MAG: hypothetical protein LQ349_009418, partial [Xanthoria aureola]
MEARQDVEGDESDEDELSESEGAESVTGSNAMDVDLEGSEDGDDDADADDDDEGAGIEYLEMRSTPDHYPTNVNHNSHAQRLPGIVTTAVNALQQAGPSHSP